MTGIELRICFYYVDQRLIEEIVSALREGSYNPIFKTFKDTRTLNDHLLKQDVDLIFADFDLPDILRESIEKYHAKNIFHVPFIYLVGEKSEERAAESLKRGVWDYIIKNNFVKLVPTVYSSQKYGKVLKRNKLMENTVQHSRNQVKNLSENTPDIIMRFDRSLRHLSVNNSVYTQIGIPPERFINKTHKEMGDFPPDLVNFWEKNLSQVFKTGDPNMVEFDIQGKDGLKTYEWRIFPEFDEQGNVQNLLTNARDITESRKAEKALKFSEERLNHVVEATSLGFWDWNLETNDIFYSRIYFEMLGYKPKDLPNYIDNLRSLLHPDDREKAISFLENSIIEKKTSFEIEFRLLCQEGSYKWIRSRGKIFGSDKDGNPIRLIGSHEDVSERKRNELKHHALFQISNAINTTSMDELYEKIRESLRPIIDTTNCFLALYNEDTGLLNLPFLRDEKDTFNNFPPGKTLTGYVLKTGKVQLFDAEREQQLMKEGLIEPVGTPCISWLGVPLNINNKTIGVFAVQSYTENIKFTNDDVKILEFVSDQIALAIERKKSQDNLRDSKEMQRRVFEASPDPIVVTNRKGQVIDYNSKFTKALGISDDKKILRLTVFRFVERSDWRRVIDSFQYAWDNGYVSNLEFTTLKQNGEKFLSEISAGAIYNEQGQPESMVIIFKDITQRKEIERSLKEAKEKAEESDRLKTAFLSNMSHEIRTPMNAIVGFSDLLKDRELNQEERNEFVAQINMGADNLMHLIDDIIDISKIEAGQLKISKSSTEIHNLMKEQLVMFRQNLSNQNKSDIDLRLNWNFHKDEIILQTDPYRLVQVINNLLNNALKFTESGFIELGMEQIRNDLRFYVKDTGIGINKEKQKIIFDRFMQGHTSKYKLYGGTGIGLAISKQLVNLLGGKIGVISEPGKGAEFWFTLPAEIGQAKPAKKKFESGVINNLDLTGKKILIAEDDPGNYHYLLEAIIDTKAEVIWAKTGTEAIEIFEKEKDSINLVLMDIRMPEMDGYECTKQIKSICPDMPVIAQTAYAMSEEKKLSAESGCDDHISKPISLDMLFQTIVKHIK